jgi:uncharacterized membrane protein
MAKKLKQIWVDYGALVLCCTYALICFILMCAKHNAFHTRIYDFARFSQAVWNTLHGRFLFSTLHYGSILGNHFSPLMALTAPLLLLWDNERLLFLTQAVNTTASVYFIQLIVKDKYPDIASWFTLIALFNPALHDVTLFEVRRVTYGMPFFALALYALYKKKRWLMLGGLCTALLAKEDMGLFVVMIGLYLIVFERDWRWGIGLVLLGGFWTATISLWIIPTIRSRGGPLAVYPQLYYYDHLGSTYNDIIKFIVQYPFQVAKMMLQPPQLLALFRILLPFGFILPFMHPQWLLFILPYLGLMFLSSDVDMIQLDKWYTAPVFPVLLSCTAIGWPHLFKTRKAAFCICFAVFTLTSFMLYSPVPMGGRYEPDLYRTTQRNKLESEMVNRVPADACVVAQNYYVPHLTHRKDLYHYPIYQEDTCAVTYFLFDKTNNAHPADLREIVGLIDAWLPDPEFVVEAEAEDIYLFRRGGVPLPAYVMNATAESSIHLDRVELALQDDEGIYVNVCTTPLSMKPGLGLRIYLYWEARDAPGAERSVSLRILDSSGKLLTQDDSMPGRGSKPTSWWDKGWAFRDIYYLVLPSDAAPGSASLEIVLYDTYTIETVPFDRGNGSLVITPVNITE